ncbi:2'-5' RNA ligase family protein [Sphingobium sp.]|uniref:2'-5' RNA ligase family protein n=1 Tax=Sphingobium sp. TaxID=1912891 RepID=UPI00262518D9|nr:2'-5' RNA ligase family protein [Sphingobium sp.]
MTDGVPAPIIVTALMGAADFAWADGLRRAHFPPERNWLGAHITLFHHLPPSALGEVAGRLKRLGAGPRPAARLTDVMLLGRGVAYRVESPELLAMRAELADAFAGMLTPQDQAKPRLHITIQNKVTPDAAKALADKLRADFRPRPLAIAGLAAWHYRGGPWELAMKAMFRG